MTFTSIKRIYFGLWAVAFVAGGAWSVLMLIGDRPDSILRIVPISVGFSAILNGVTGFTHKLMVARSGATMRLEEEALGRRWLWPSLSIMVGLVFVVAGIFAP